MATIQSVRDQIRTAIARGNYDQAISLVGLIRGSFPNDFETMELLGQVYLENGQYTEARKTFEAVLEIDPENVLSRSALAVVAEEEGHLEEALARFERAFDINTSNQSVAEEIRRLHAQLGHSRPMAPGSSVYARARRLLRDAKHDAAVPVFEDALRMEPESAEVAVGRALALWLAGRLKKAEVAAREILIEHPYCLKAMVLLAGAALARGDGEALRILGRTAEFNPGNSIARGLIEKAGLQFPYENQPLEVPDPQEEEAVLEVAEEAGEPAAEETLMAEAAVEESSAGPGDRDEALAVDVGASEGEGVEVVAAETVVTESAPAEPQLPPAEQPSPTLELPMDEAESQWAKRRAKVEDPSTEKQREGHAALHISFGRSFEAKGELDLAISEYRKAIEVHPSLAAVVGEAAIAMAKANPGSVKAGWLAGDALATAGQFRRAMEQYLVVLKNAMGSSPEGGEPSPE